MRRVGHAGSAPVVARQFRELAQRFAEQRSSLVLTGDPIALPREIAHRAVFFPFAPPGPAELDAVLRAVVKSLSGSANVNVTLAAGDREALIRALQGMTLNQTRQARATVPLSVSRAEALAELRAAAQGRFVPVAG